MNKQRREQLHNIHVDLFAIYQRVEEIATDEQDAADNMPENMQGGEKHERMEEIAETLRRMAEDLEAMYSEMEELLN